MRRRFGGNLVNPLTSSPAAQRDKRACRLVPLPCRRQFVLWKGRIYNVRTTLGAMARNSHLPDGASEPAASERLDSWKEIAAFLKRDVRTVQRWEKLAGLPVHRHAASRLRTAYAYRSELEAWWRDQRSLTDAVTADVESSDTPPDHDSLAPEETGDASPIVTVPPAAEVPTRHGSSRWIYRPGFLALAAVLCLAVALTTFLLRWAARDNEPMPTAGDEAVPVLLAPFEDHAGRPGLAVELHESFGRGLGRGGVVEAVGSSRIAGTLRLMRRDPSAALTAAVAREVAVRDARIRFVVMGRVHAIDSIYLADVQVLDPSAGRIVASVEWKAETAEALLDGIDDQSRRLSAMISATSPSSRPPDDLLEPVTTGALSAVRLYTAAVHAGARGQWGAAELLARRRLPRIPTSPSRSPGRPGPCATRGTTVTTACRCSSGRPRFRGN